jgi:hypothetical protein
VIFIRPKDQGRKGEELDGALVPDEVKHLVVVQRVKSLFLGIQVREDLKEGRCPFTAGFPSEASLIYLEKNTGKSILRKLGKSQKRK